MFSLILLPFLFILSSSQSLSIPTELTTGFTTSTNLIVTYGANELTSGETVALSLTQSAPTFALGDSDGINTNANYIILCIDPDAPAPASQVLHFLGTDFSPAPGIGTNLSSDVDAALEYAPPAPPQGTGRHRYVWLLYRQPRGFVISDVPENRTGFDVQAWRGKNSLAEAVAGTFFVAEFGDGGVVSSSTRAPAPTGGTTLTSPLPFPTPTGGDSETGSAPSATASAVTGGAGRREVRVGSVVAVAVAAVVGLVL